MLLPASISLYGYRMLSQPAYLIDFYILFSSGSNLSTEENSMEELRAMIRENLSVNQPVEQVESFQNSGVPNPNSHGENGMLSGETTDIFVNPTDFESISRLYRPEAVDSVYKMTSSPRGIAVIINIENFEPDPEKCNQKEEKLERREGSNVDADNLEKLFLALNFKVEKLTDKKENEIWDELKKISKNVTLKASDCFVMCIMSHGKNGYFYSHDAGKIEISKIKKMFDNANCKALCGKPKLFFIQACRGKFIDFGRTVSDAPSEHGWGDEKHSFSMIVSFFQQLFHWKH